MSNAPDLRVRARPNRASNSIDARYVIIAIARAAARPAEGPAPTGYPPALPRGIGLDRHPLRGVPGDRLRGVDGGRPNTTTRRSTRACASPTRAPPSRRATRRWRARRARRRARPAAARGRTRDPRASTPEKSPSPPVQSAGRWSRSSSRAGWPRGSRDGRCRAAARDRRSVPTTRPRRRCRSTRGTRGSSRSHVRRRRRPARGNAARLTEDVATRGDEIPEGEVVRGHGRCKCHGHPSASARVQRTRALGREMFGVMATSDVSCEWTSGSGGLSRS